MSILSKISQITAQLPSGVDLVAVSKTHPLEAVQIAYDGGQRRFGESRPKELKLKFEALPKDIEWHMIGHLQTNKVRMIAPFVSMIESLDSDRLAREINKEAIRCDRTIDVLLEIHVADEQSKTGWDYSSLVEFIKNGGFRELTNIRIRGVMGIATNTSDEGVIRRDFNLLYQYKQELAQYFDSSFDTLSMGMSHDYLLAVECGSTSVRVGSLIFGDRDYSRD